MQIKRDKILIIGANGQLGSELTEELRSIYGVNNVIASDVSSPRLEEKERGIFEQLDVLNATQLGNIINKYEITQIYHLAAVLSATGEKNPKFAWKLNMDGLFNVLDVAVEKKLSKIYWPSSIAVFGPHTPSDATPQHTTMDPNTIYGISKQAGERWCEYYYLKHQLDIRSLRYPGLIGYKSLPGGGTTDYAVDIFYKAINGEHFNCFLSENTFLPMMYMPDAIKATLDLMHTDIGNIKERSSYNISSISFSPAEISSAIKKIIPTFSISYQPDFRQKIADSWPNTIDDTAARRDWGWQPQYDLDRMTKEMILNLKSLKEKVQI